MSLAVWIEASRPKTLIASIAPVLVGTILAHRFSLLTFLVALFTALSIQIGTNLANDYFDFIKGADTPLRKGPRRVTQAGLVSLPAMRLAVFLTFATTALLSSYLVLQGGPIFALMTTLAILLGLGYSAGPFPLSYLGIADIFVLVFFGPVFTAAAYYLQEHAFAWLPVIMGLCPGLLSTAILTVNNLRDREEDRTTGKKTLIVRLGATFGKWEYTVCIIAACLLPCFYGRYLPLITLIPAIVPLRAVWKGMESPHQTLAQTGRLLLGWTILFGVGI